MVKLGMAVVVCLALAQGTSASAQELANDGFGAGMTVVYQGGFDPGEVGAVRLVPTGRVQLMSVSFLLGGGTSTETMTVHVWDDSAGTDTPGAELFVADFDVTGQDDARQDIDLSGESIIVSGPFRIGIEFNHRGFPGLGADSDGNIAADKNFIRTAPPTDAGVGGTWARSQSLGLAGDFIVRANVRAFAQTPDAGVRDAGRDGGGDAAVDGGSSGDDGGGCGCRTAGRPRTSALPWLAGAGLGLALLARARRRRLP